MDRIKAAFVGCGGICNFHLSHLVQFDDVDYVGFMDIRPERAREKAAQVGGAPVFDNYCQMLDEAKPDVLYICVPPDQHGTLEFEAIKRKIHFLVEKPMALSMELATRIRDAAAEAGIITAVGFQDRYLDVIEKTREFLKGRQVGLVDGAWLGGIPGVYWWPTYATSGGQIVEQNIHLFDMLRYLFGEPERVYCAAARGIVKRDGYDLHDYSSAVITFKNKVIATLFTGCYLARNVPNKNGLHIRCADADIRYILRQSVELDTGSYVELHRREIDQGVTEDRTFLDAVKTCNPAIIRSPYADACKSLALTLACNESIATGKEIVLD
ncbi:MAG: Gfo/Idh/MocA family oxidoreductase [Clostridiaceae bacterium]|jgi:predicted dehydrogenase|nr:Gfo/Idh/MocA family oxidoreductase [Eubacteriales bacterium]NLB45457.1 Gfo/Idh/MocA family oxidoreductase [Clostridiaceae bacterium]